MKIVFAASEAAPFIKTGGLGDVAEALPAALSEYKGNEVSVFLPYYKQIKEDKWIEVELIGEFETDLSWRRAYVGLFKLKSRKRKLQIYFIDNDHYFGRSNLYGEFDDGERFAFFCKAILESLVFMRQTPDIIHCNDWQTALIPTLLHAFYSETLGKAKTVFTIHNIEYQGWADPSFIGEVLGLDDNYKSTFEFGGAINLLKGGILVCDALTTVSKSYADEICTHTYAHGLAGIIADHSFKTVGIINGIDQRLNDPASDKSLEKNYTVGNFKDGKAEAKKALQKTLGLPINKNIPLVGIVSRLASHKGIDLLCDAIDGIMSSDIQLVILGTGEHRLEERLKEAAERHRDKISLNLCFSGELASKIYAASDIYLMPSLSEPCGLSQMLAMHYGAVPVVHGVGGLKDTVLPFDKESGEGFGFLFGEFNADRLISALEDARSLYCEDRKSFEKAIYNCMSADFSWKKPSSEYMALYKKLIESQKESE